MDNMTQKPGAIASPHLFRLLGTWRGQKMYFLEPGGNFGDQLICRGAYKLAGLAGIRAEIIDVSALDVGRVDARGVVFIHGSGGFVPMWSGTPMKYLKRLSQSFRGTVIVGPSTVIDDRHVARGMLESCVAGASFERFHVFAREKTSLSVFREFFPRETELHIDHDTALNLERSDLINEKPGKRRYILNAIRNDKERIGERDYNFWSWVDPVLVSKNIDDWLRLHDRAKIIVTNRAHSAVLGSILGVLTYMLPNSYHKNKSIYEYSLRGRGVRWLSDLDAISPRPCVLGDAVIGKRRLLSALGKCVKFRLRHLTL